MFPLESRFKLPVPADRFVRSIHCFGLSGSRRALQSDCLISHMWFEAFASLRQAFAEMAERQEDGKLGGRAMVLWWHV